jgi:hypothetical protein
MHSPPPTPNSRANGRATRTKDALSLDVDHRVISRKRTIEQAGLVTPQDTPRKVDLNKHGELLASDAAKVLFPSTRRKKIQVFEDPSSPDPFCDDQKNPFKPPGRRTKRSRSPEKSGSRSERQATPDRDTDVLSDPLDTSRRSGRKTRSMARSPSPRRTDGMTYVFRGKKVFRKYDTAEEAESAEAIQPKRLFVKEMTAPKLANPFLDEGSDEDGFDGLELSTYHDVVRRPLSANRLAHRTARTLF